MECWLPPPPPPPRPRPGPVVAAVAARPSQLDELDCCDWEREEDADVEERAEKLADADPSPPPLDQPRGRPRSVCRCVGMGVAPSRAAKLAPVWPSTSPSPLSLPLLLWSAPSSLSSLLLSSLLLSSSPSAALGSGEINTSTILTVPSSHAAAITSHAQRHPGDHAISLMMGLEGSSSSRNSMRRYDGVPPPVVG